MDRETKRIEAEHKMTVKEATDALNKMASHAHITEARKRHALELARAVVTLIIVVLSKALYGSSGVASQQQVINEVFHGHRDPLHFMLVILLAFPALKAFLRTVRPPAYATPVRRNRSTPQRLANNARQREYVHLMVRSIIEKASMQVNHEEALKKQRTNVIENHHLPIDVLNILRQHYEKHKWTKKDARFLAGRLRNIGLADISVPDLEALIPEVQGHGHEVYAVLHGEKPITNRQQNAKHERLTQLLRELKTTSEELKRLQNNYAKNMKTTI